MRSPFLALSSLLLLVTIASACASSDAGNGAAAGLDATPESAGPDASDAAGDPADGPSGADADAAHDAEPCTLVRAYSQLDPECNACAERECCNEINTCLLDVACDDSFVNCMLACLLDADADAGTVEPCIDDCAVQYPTGKAEYDIAIGCAESKCAVECG